MKLPLVTSTRIATRAYRVSKKQESRERPTIPLLRMVPCNGGAVIKTVKLPIILLCKIPSLHHERIASIGILAYAALFSSLYCSVLPVLCTTEKHPNNDEQEHYKKEICGGNDAKYQRKQIEIKPMIYSSRRWMIPII